MGARHGRLARFVLWLLLGGWIGALVFFQAVLAPSAFAVLPAAELAGRVVGRSLGILNLAGVAIGAALAGVALRLGRRRALVLLPLALAALCLVSHFGVTPALAELRAAAPGLDDPAVRQRFAQLHGVSLGLFGLTEIGAVLLLALHVRVEASPQAREKRKNA